MAVASIARLLARILEWVAKGMQRFAAAFDPPAVIVAVAVPVGGAAAQVGGAATAEPALSLRDLRRRTQRTMRLS